MTREGRKKTKFFWRAMCFLAMSLLLVSYLSPYIAPVTFWPLAYFGLLYLVILGFAVIVLGFLIFRQSKYSWALLAALLLGLPLHKRTFATSFGKNIKNESQKLEGAYKLMSYNVRLFGLYDEGSDEKRESIINFLEHHNADVSCFQEFFHNDYAKNFLTRNELLPRLGIEDYHEGYSKKNRSGKNFGLVTMSKFPIHNEGEILLKEYKGDRPFCIYTDIVFPEDTIRVYNVHLQSIRLEQREIEMITGENEKIKESEAVKGLLSKFNRAFQMRSKQAQVIIDHSLNSPYKNIICGDFNDTPLSYVYGLFNEAYADVFRKHTWGIGSTYVGRLPAGRIDYIFASEELNTESFHRQKYPLSDHRAIWTHLRLENNP